MMKTGVDEPLGFDPNLESIFLHDIWLTMEEIPAVMDCRIQKMMYQINKTKVELFDDLARLDSSIEVTYYQYGGILHYVLRSFLRKDKQN